MTSHSYEYGSSNGAIPESAAHVPACSSKGAKADAHVEERDEGTHGHTGGDREPDAVTKALMCTSWAFRQAADSIDRALQEVEIQLAMRHGSSAMDDVQSVAIEPSEQQDQPPQGARLLTLADLAAMLQVAEKTVRRWRTEGKLPPAVELGGVVRWRREDVDNWIAAQVEGTK